MEKVSVIIPVYNMEDNIEEGLGCVTSQTYENLEIIIIDDGSKDKTYMKCLAAADNDRRIAVFGKNNEGPGKARNFALRKATGKYVYFFDMDDYIKPNAISRLVETMEKTDADLVACGFDMFDGKKITRTVKKIDAVCDTPSAMNDYSEYMLMYGEKGIQGAPWYKLYKMSIIRENGIEFPPIRYGEDDVFIAEYVKCTKRFALISDVLCRYYINNCRRFWDKYRFDMFDTAAEHTRLMLETVCKWNPSDIETRSVVYRDYFQKTFSSLCSLFNPYTKISPKRRMERIKVISDTFAAQTPDDDFGVDHPVFTAMKRGKYKKIYIRILLHVTRHRFDT